MAELSRWCADPVGYTVPVEHELGSWLHRITLLLSARPPGSFSVVQHVSSKGGHAKQSVIDRVLLLQPAQNLPGCFTVTEPAVGYLAAAVKLPGTEILLACADLGAKRVSRPQQGFAPRAHLGPAHVAGRTGYAVFACASGALVDGSVKSAVYDAVVADRAAYLARTYKSCGLVGDFRGVWKAASLHSLLPSAGGSAGNRRLCYVLGHLGGADCLEPATRHCPELAGISLPSGALFSNGCPLCSAGVVQSRVPPSGGPHGCPHADSIPLLFNECASPLVLARKLALSSALSALFCEVAPGLPPLQASSLACSEVRGTGTWAGLQWPSRGPFSRWEGGPARFLPRVGKPTVSVWRLLVISWPCALPASWLVGPTM